ncbi:DUF4444 domain-containing protein [Pikeienuella piscinae]|uniref:DUF4444 domain-containing protein n=1 Tax=Pikeienuella piscinae TaxID=2748098 RepID=A0A7L5BW11_9RHOB|nr:biotin/lipoate--protein ligase family protein [Pikeienuella piscinae]QIE55611.1 DUF4444 domain-containing protein [Pikeienuella piscinae]
MSDLSFPPLLRGETAPDPFRHAVAAAQQGADPGLIAHNESDEKLAAALILAPECALEDAMAMVFACGLGFSDALGALAPPELAAHLAWPDGLWVNGARCGGFRAAASTIDPEAEPAWLVIGVEVPLAPIEGEPGRAPNRTSLHEEGCGDIPAPRLIESWSRHMLVWINYWLDDGMARLHAEWRARAWRLGKQVSFSLKGTAQTGDFIGIDERGGMLLRDGAATRLIPLTAMLED